MLSNISWSLTFQVITTETLFGTMNKTLRLLEMGFTGEEVSAAIERFGQLSSKYFLLKMWHHIPYNLNKLQELVSSIVWCIGCTPNHEQFEYLGRTGFHPFITHSAVHLGQDGYLYIDGILNIQVDQDFGYTQFVLTVVWIQNAS